MTVAQIVPKAPECTKRWSVAWRTRKTPASVLAMVNGFLITCTLAANLRVSSRIEPESDKKRVYRSAQLLSRRAIQFFGADAMKA